MTHLAPLDFWLSAPADILRDKAFTASQFAAEEISVKGIAADAARDIAIRLRALLDARKDDIGDFAPMIEALTREVGLFPYLDDSISVFSDAIAKEAFRSPSDPSLVFHLEQQRIFSSLQKGNNVVASAPTSFGKSMIIDSIIRQERIERTALIVPTIALLDETRKRITEKCQGNAVVIFSKSQGAPSSGKVVFIGTQERLVDREDIGLLDILIVDEFYKADPIRADNRFVVLNAAISKLSRNSKQFFLIGPYIDGIDAKAWRYADVDFIKTSYRSVAVDTIDVEESRNNIQTLITLIEKESNAPSLIFVKSPKSAGDLVSGLVQSGMSRPTKWSIDLAAWLSDNYTPDWNLVKGLQHGIAYHHGRLPRSIASVLVNGFNSGGVKTLICTSTLIEGVNTAAKSVFIWDKKIDGRDIDFFTYSNIKGRAGRMGKHFVGKVYRFHPEPDIKENQVSVPGLGERTDIDEISVHFDERETSNDTLARIENWKTLSGLDREQLRRHSGLGFGRLQKLKEIVDLLPQESRDLLSWSQFPRYEQLKTTCEIIWKTFDLSRSGVRSGSQMTLFVWRLYIAKSFKSFLNQMLSGAQSPNVEDLFAFLRACEFSIPEMMASVEASLHNNINIDCDFKLFIARLENWFLPPNVKSLEEAGFPIVLFERLHLRFGDDQTIHEYLSDVIEAARSREDVSPIEIMLIENAI